jgi:flavin-dependent dehydrogenase
VPVTIHEAGTYPRHRVCGEFIAGLRDETISRLGLAPALRGTLRHREVAWFHRDTALHVQRLPEPALGVSRHTLDAALAREFVERGGGLLTRARISDAEHPRPGRVLAYGRRRHMRSRWIGLKLHVRDLPLTRELEVHLGDSCYVGLAQLPDGAVNLCGLFRRRSLGARGPELLLRHLRAAGLPALAARFERASIDQASFCAVAAVDFDRRVLRDACIRIGDAAAMIPPFTGNGMAMAFQSAEAALAPLIAYSRGECDWSDAVDATHAALRRRFGARLWSAAGLHSFLLQPKRQRILTALARARLLPFRTLYTALH